MKEIKVSLKVTLQGRVPFSQEECLKTTKTYFTNKKGKKVWRLDTVVDKSKTELNTFKVDKEIVHFVTRKCKPAYQQINLDVDQYKYMISTSDNPVGCTPSKWKRMHTKERLEYHLKGICEALGGTGYSYYIFED